MKKTLNTIHPLLQFTLTKNQQEICFLDVRVIKKGDQVHMTLFTKPTDRNNLLRRDSHHAPQTFKGIPRGQFMRARKICSGDAEYHEHKQILIDKLTSKGYDRQNIIETGEAVASMERTELLKSKKKK